MKNYLNLLVFMLIIILLIFHLNNFLKVQDKYQILQINKKIVNYQDYFNENHLQDLKEEFERLINLIKLLLINISEFLNISF